MNHVKRIFVEKRLGFDEQAQSLRTELQDFLEIKGLENLRLINRYDLVVNQDDYHLIRENLFPSTITEQIYEEELPLQAEEKTLTKEYLPGQFEPKTQATLQSMKLLVSSDQPLVRTAQIMILTGDISPQELERIASYWINPLEAQAALWDKPATLSEKQIVPKDVAVLEGFRQKTGSELEQLYKELGLAMSMEDFVFCQAHFGEQEKRDPTITEIKIIDTYWSDHCRHKTFFTPIREVIIEDAPLTKPIQQAYQTYLKARETVFVNNEKEVCLMDLALIGMRELKGKGYLNDLDISEEINACSINVTVDINGKPEDWLIMFKNETHNHPTEIEPRGGAETCLGGAIRDPLSGRSYIYQAMRITGSGDPRRSFLATMADKLPQRQITREAAAGYSSYGNQIGVPTGQVAEIYDEGYVAKRMELGAVIAATPKENVRRESPEPGDVVLLVGNKTGRDGCGGATGSSREHTDIGEEDSSPVLGSDVPKGNPSEERKLLRLFRNPEASKLIKKCNDFGAGGVSVAIGELADGLIIDLDAIPTAYEGLDGTELAISESQERMAVVVAPEQAPTFIQLAAQENLTATAVAGITPEHRVKMVWRSKLIVDLERHFLDTGGIKGEAAVKVIPPNPEENCFQKKSSSVVQALPDLKSAWLANLGDLNVCSQKSLADRFDSTAGGGTIIAPYGGKYQATPAEGMVARVPLITGETTTGTIMTFGYNPQIARWSPFHGGLYAVIEAVAKNVALGGDHRQIRMTFQEYFEKLEEIPEKWGKPFSSLLGAYWAQHNFLIPAIGGKDSMSGTFQELHVPPTLVAFTVNTVDIRKAITSDFKKPNSQIVLVPALRDENEMPDFNLLNQNFAKVHDLIKAGHVLASGTIKTGGLAATLSQMAFGNRLGFTLDTTMVPEDLFSLDYGTIVLEIAEGIDLAQVFGEVAYRTIGLTSSDEMIRFNDLELSLQEAYQAWATPLNEVFADRIPCNNSVPILKEYKSYKDRNLNRPSFSVAKPRVLIPVFPGTNGEYEVERAFAQVGGLVKTLVFKDQIKEDIRDPLTQLAQRIKDSQILMLPGGFSNWDEPDGAGKYITAILRQPMVQEGIMTLLEKDGLILGIGNGFQTLVRLGLLPYGEIREHNETAPILTLNQIGHHVSHYTKTKVVSTLSPWFHHLEIGEEHTVPVSCTEGRFVAESEECNLLFAAGQIATQFIDLNSTVTGLYPYNPTGSYHGIEGITSPDGRILGKIGHSERSTTWGAINIPGNKEQRIFAGGIAYFK